MKSTFVRHITLCARPFALLLTILLASVVGCNALDELTESDGPSGRRAKTGDARCFESFYKAKKYLHKHGSTKKAGWQWHHIVGQHKANVAKFGARNLHCTDNLVYLPKQTHKQINSHYQKIHKFTKGKRLREWLADKDFDKQYQFGIEVLADFGYKP